MIRDGVAYAPRLVPASASPTGTGIGADDTVLITGASGGLGTALARHLAPRVRGRRRSHRFGLRRQLGAARRSQVLATYATAILSPSSEFKILLRFLDH